MKLRQAALSDCGWKLCEQILNDFAAVGDFHRAAVLAVKTVSSEMPRAWQTVAIRSSDE